MGAQNMECLQRYWELDGRKGEGRHYRAPLELIAAIRWEKVSLLVGSIFEVWT